MKRIKILILLLVLPLFSFSQDVKYSLDFGVNFNYFSLKTKDIIGTSSATYDGYKIYASEFLFEIESKPLNGYFIESNIKYVINNSLFFKSGIGISLNNCEKTFKLLPNIIVEDLTIYYENDENSWFRRAEFKDYTEGYSGVHNILSLFIPLNLGVNLFNNRLAIITCVSPTAIIFDNFEYPFDHREFRFLFLNTSLKIEYMLFGNFNIGTKFTRNITPITKTMNIIPITNKYSYSTFNFTNVLPKANLRLNSFSIYLTYKF